jgi:eukaryotic-like serine/threonine-protein kinase
MSLTNLKPGTVIGGRYEIQRPLGSGAMGIVYLATHRELGTSLAIKFLDAAVAAHPEAAERFRREGRAAVAIRHPGIVRMMDLDATPEGVRYLVMEYLQGPTLSDLLDRAGTLKPAVAAAVLVPMLDALEAAHAAGVVHRDLKPANVMLSTSPNQAVKLLDFGISKLTRDPKLTTPGATMGTPDYMAPEQTLDAKAVTASADLYSLGTIAFEMLSGRRPFIANNVAEMMFQVLQEPPPRLDSVVGELDPRLCELVDALLTKDPLRRPQTAAGVRTALLAAVKPDPAALWKLVHSPDEVGFAPTFARPSPATPQQLAQLARTLPESEAVPEPVLPPGVPRRSARPTALAPQAREPSTQKNVASPSARTEQVQPIALPQRSSLPLVLGGLVVLLVGVGALFAFSKKAPPVTVPAVVVTARPAPEPLKTEEPTPEPPKTEAPTPEPPKTEAPTPEPPRPALPPARKAPVKSKARLIVEQGTAAAKAGRLVEAKQKFTECKNAFPEDADCRYGLYTVLTELNEVDAAQKELRAYQGLKPR